MRTHAQKYFKKLARTKGKNGEREQEQAGNITAKNEDTVCTRHPHYTTHTKPRAHAVKCREHKKAWKERNAHLAATLRSTRRDMHFAVMYVFYLPLLLPLGLRRAHGNRVRTCDGAVADIPVLLCRASPQASTMEKSTTIMRDKSGAVLRRDGQRKTGGGGGAGAMAAAAAAAAAGASKGTSAAAAAAFVTVTSAAGGSFPDIKSDGNGGGSQADSCEETSEGKRSSNCVPSSIDSDAAGDWHIGL